MQVGYYLFSVVFLLIYLGISFIVVNKLHLTGTAEMAVRTILMALGFGLFGMLLFYIQDRKRKKEAAAQTAQTASAGQPAPVEQEIDDLVHHARKQLASSQIGKKASLANLPAIFIMGESSAAKTSIVVHSGAEPDLLAGHVFQDNATVATRPANLWLVDRSIFVEPGGTLLADQNRWTRLIKQLQPSRWKSLFSKQKPSRAALVCVDAETFLGGGPDAALATARKLNARLSDISHGFGIQLPVYVLFTKLDKLSYFAEFASVLTDGEANQAFGVTLPVLEGNRRGVYAEEQSRILTAGFNDLFHSLAQKRLAFLSRENAEEKLARIYEFPREFRKLRSLLVRFLVDLGRPSQLRAQPVIRGFYFSGVRPIVLEEKSDLARPTRSALQSSNPEATRLFNPDRDLMPAGGQQPEAALRSRRVPQWVFLGRLFSELILQDSKALAYSSDIGSQLRRRILLSAALAASIALCFAITMSWLGNRELENDALRAAQGISLSERGGGAQALPSLDSLRRLDTLRESAALLSRYRQQGAPWGLRWGLYAGNTIYPSVRKIYFNTFHKLLLGESQESLLETLRKLPQKPSATDKYKPAYDALKGYLMTTSFPGKSQKSFLSPLLMERWMAGREVDGERRALAQKQFDFYAEELLLGNPFSSETDGETVERSRYYLSQFNAAERIYQFILAEASRQKPSINFNRQFAGSSAYVVNNREVAGAFTAAGWTFVQEAFRTLKRFFGGERWVLGDRAYADLDPDKLAPELNQRYEKEYLGNWRAYLADSQIVRYGSVADAARKLAQLSSNQSYLLSMFCLATVNTISSAAPFVSSLQPVHYVEPKGCPDKYVQQSNAGYVSALVSLQTSLERVAKTAVPDDSAVQATLSEATNAYRVTRQVAQNFQIDKEGNIHQLTQKLMEDPIKYAEAVVDRLGPVQLNSEGRHFCESFSDLSRKYPFNTATKVDASLPEIEAFFRPGDGRLFTFIEQSLKNYVEKRNGRYFSRSDTHVQVTQQFLQFLNRAAALSEALYKNGGNGARISYTMRALPAAGLQTVKLTLDGQTLTAPGQQGGGLKEFTWPGNNDQGARLAGSVGGTELSFISYSGLWAAFRFFGDADRFQAAGNNYSLKWAPRQGQSAQPMLLGSGQAVELPFELDLKGAPPVFQKGYLSGMKCSPDVAH